MMKLHDRITLLPSIYLFRTSIHKKMIMMVLKCKALLKTAEILFKECCCMISSTNMSVYYSISTRAYCALYYNIYYVYMYVQQFT